MAPLTDDENKHYEEQKECYIGQKEFCHDKNQRMKFKLYKMLEIIVVVQENLEKLLIVFAM